MSKRTKEQRIEQCTDTESCDTAGVLDIFLDGGASEKKGVTEHPSEIEGHFKDLKSSHLKSSKVTGHNRDAFYEQIEKLSSTAIESVQKLIDSLNNGSATIDDDELGRPVVHYKQKRKLNWDANKIAISKSSEDLKVKMDAFLEMYEYLINAKPPAGILFDETKILLNNGKYREGIEFENTGEILGTGNSAGKILVIKDKNRGKEHALKPIMRQEELRAWIDLNGDGIGPEVYMFRLDGDKIVVHMEILDNSMTLSKVINNVHMENLTQNTMTWWLFSMFILSNLLSAVQLIHEKGWTHGDLHLENILIQKKSDCEMKVRVLDFGNARRIDDKGGNLKSDALHAVRNCSALYLRSELISDIDVERDWLDIVLKIEEPERVRMFCLLAIAMNVKSTNDIVELKKNADNFGQLNTDKVNQIMKALVPLLFPAV